VTIGLDRRAGSTFDITFGPYVNARGGLVTFILEVPNDLERDLEQAAARAGVPLAEYALQILAASRSSTTEPDPRNGAELVAFWKREGLIGTRTDIEDPVRHARELRERAQTRGGA
jgi:hypothetical protein